MNGSDYVVQSNVLLIFNANTRRTEVEVDLIDDSVNETVEAFNGILTLVPNSQRVTVNPDKALATIEDEGVKLQSQIHSRETTYTMHVVHCTPLIIGEGQ